MMHKAWMFTGLALLAGPGTAAAQPPAQAPAQNQAPTPAHTPTPAQTTAPAHPLSLAEAEQMALRQSPELTIAHKSVSGAGRRLEAARAQRLPRLSVESSVIVWNEELAFDLTPPGVMLPPGMEPSGFTVRERVTTSTTVTLAQPLTGQIAMHELVQIEQAGVAASEADYQATRLDVAYRATDGYLTVLLVKAAQDVAQQRVAQVEAQLARARVLVEGGVLQPLDVMRLEAALAAAQREVLTAESQARLAQGSLILTLGLPPDATVEVRDDMPEQPGAPPASVPEAVATASDKRPDLQALTLRAEQAESGADAAQASLWPTVAAIATFQYNTGSSLQAPTAWFGGLSLQWNVWDWGQTWQNYKQAEIQAEQVRLVASRAGDQVRMQVSAAALDAQSAYEALAVSRTGLGAAEEAFRIQNDRFQEGVATTTDVLDAQTEVTQARLGYASARYAYFRALAALARATGQMPSALLSAI